MAWADEASFSTFYGRTARALWAYVYRATGNAADADDIVQDAYCRLVGADVEALDDDDRRRSLFRIASNLMTDRWRRAAREQSWRDVLESLWHGATPAAADVGLEATFQQLKARDRALLWLAYVEEHDHKTIAAALGVGVGSVKVLLSRARERLRALLKSGGIMGEHRG